MNATEVRERLLAEGCSPNNFVVQGHGSDVFCLALEDGVWSVFYTERGIDSPPIFSSPSEETACQFFFDHVMKMQHWHMVGFFEDEASARAMEDRLSAAGIRAIRNDMPAYRARNDPRYRVFVVGRDIFRFKEAFGEPNLTNER